MKQVIAVLLLASVPVWAGYTYEISSGYFGTLMLKDSESLLMTGGGGRYISCSGSCILDIHNTSSPVVVNESGIMEISMGGSCRLNFSGGSVSYLSIGSDATAILNGGQISLIKGYYDSPGYASHITVYCCPDWTYQNNFLSGLWFDGTPFSINLVGVSAPSDPFSNITIIPEPATLLLMSLGGLWIRRKK